MSRPHDFDALAKSLRGRSPVRGSLLLLTILVLIAAAALWAHLTEIDDVTRADGRIVPSGDVQVIDAAENAVLEKLDVAEGDLVDKGQVLMELDGVQMTSDLGQEQQKAYGLEARITRLKAEISGEALDFAPALIEHAPEVVRSETDLYRGRADALATDIAILESQRVQRAQELAEGKTDIDTAEASLAILSQERALMAPLVERGIEPQTTLLSLAQTETELTGKLVRARAAVPRLQSALQEIDQQIAAQRKKYRTDALTDLALATADLAALKPALPALEQRARRARIRAPVRGIVNRIHRTTLGSMARAGEQLIEIVPLDDSLLVEAYIRPKDIAFLYPGQKVKVKITAYDYARYGSLDGEILRIGADAIQRSERDEEEVYVAEIRTRSNILDAEGAAVQIMPGMIAQVDILSGKKSVLDYIIRPVIKVKDSAFRE
ncbi:HlyD family type I secretion periplasmic adaptor subunit [Pseudooceanicola sp. CBS1P-1]|uniref:Membrane fusion protein (MFP) family protein n=1 Tax=Pseudooceanicola albus TaxID=2692189 RepID=A0A6L7GBA1_9RHOB|nr:MULTISPECIES: HlyD family type I secretion periplasmic adaptor subunit [Pseudooceanicola]MBT9386708.1 HlyD family type I secretion periplasmic adaptor subunit [Pseudooceanicola endophyticus]MXN20808.1 HlyD family type I secretion periplasmic adaptor subunit [Pseudooceanicola albus]